MADPCSENQKIPPIGLTPAKAPRREEVTTPQPAEIQLRESLETLRLLIAQHPAAVVMFDREMRYLAVSQRWLQDYGITGEVIGHSHYEIFPEIPERWKEVHRRCLAGATERADEDCFERADSSVQWLKWECRPWHNAAGEISGLILYAEDITARKQAELALQENEARITSIVDSAMDAIVTVDEQQNIVLFNPAAEQMFQCPAAEAIGQPLDRFIPARYHAAHRQHHANFGRNGITQRSMNGLGTVYGLRANGEEFPLEASISQATVKGAKLFTAILRDITRRKRNETLLLEQAAMLNQANEAIFVRDLENRIRYWNQGAERLYGWRDEEVMEQKATSLLHREVASHQEEALQITLERGEWAGELRQLAKDGKELIVEARWTLIRNDQGAPQSILAINTDITEKKKLEQQFLRAQRLEGIGTLAGGIAHDLNNVLAPLTMGVQMLQMRHADEFSQKMLGVMTTNLNRSAAMVQQILSFVRGTAGQHVAVQVQHLIKEMIKLMRETFPKEIAIHQQLSPALWLIEGDPTQLHQVLMNLCVNGRDAMPRGGKLTLTAENHTLDDLSARMIVGAQAGTYVMISVTDTGTGIAHEHLDRIFDPFFTTKDPGKGTGLGLATVYGIVKAHGGFINVYSEPGHGTQFKIYLPAQATPQEKESRAPRIPSAPVGKGELILVVDDEAAIREITRTTLEAFGYRVLRASDGVEAISLYAQHKDDVRLVLTDMMMPLMDGPTMIRTLQRLNPQVVVVGSSGLSEEGKAAEAYTLGVTTILSKPYNAETLLNTVARAIQEGK